jgi:hypothetical protein
MTLYQLRGLDDPELDKLIERLEQQTRYQAETALGRRLVGQLLNMLTACRLEQDRRCCD